MDINTLLPLDIFMLPAQVIFSLAALYFFILGMAGLVQYRIPHTYEPQKKFAVIIPAHNEEMVIGPLVDNLKNINYPQELYDIFIIADNCTDKTALIGREHGAIVYERFDEVQKGKGYALEWMFNKLNYVPKEYDAVAIFDADNLVDPEFLKHMNNRLCSGAKIVQGYIDAKNPTDTWVTASFAISFWVANRMLQLARYNLGLSNYLGGTGMVISLDVLKKIGWGATSLTEDMEFSLKALLQGYKTSWAHEAIVYDEKPLTFGQAWRQRKRWALGHVEILRTYSMEFIRQTILKRNIVLLDALVVTLQPLLAVSMGFFTVLSLINLKFELFTPIFQTIWPPLLWELVRTLQILYPFLVIWLDKLPQRLAKWAIVHYPIFLYSWIIIVTIGLFSKNTRVSWSHTLHTRGISYAEISRNR